MSGQRCTSAEGRNPCTTPTTPRLDRKSTRLNSSHLVISYAVFCLKKKQRSVAHAPHRARLYPGFDVRLRVDGHDDGHSAALRVDRRQLVCGPRPLDPLGGSSATVV